MAQSRARSQVYRVEYVDGEDRYERDVPLAVESPLEIVVNDVPLLSIQRLPGEDASLALGFLLSEGMLAPGAITGIAEESSPAGDRVCVRARTSSARLQAIARTLRLAAGCARGFTRGEPRGLFRCAQRVDLFQTMHVDEIRSLMSRFMTRSDLYRDTRGVHSAGLALHGEVRHFAEDIGRHNAVDKVLGQAFMAGEKPAELRILSSGRISLEVCAKAVRFGVPIVISSSASTSMAVDLARQNHVALVGRARGRQMKIYSAPFRIEGGRTPAPGSPSPEGDGHPESGEASDA